MNTTAQEWVLNKKTGNVGLVISRYVDGYTGKRKVEVAVLGIMTTAYRAYWLESSTITKADHDALTA